MAELAKQKRITDILTPTQAAAATMAEVILDEPNVFAALEPFEQELYMRAARSAIDAYFVWGGAKPDVSPHQGVAWETLRVLTMRERAERLAEMLGRNWAYLFEADLRGPPRVAMRWAVWWCLWRWPWPDASSGPIVADATNGTHPQVFAAARSIEAHEGPTARDASTYIGVLARKVGGDAVTVEQLLKSRWKRKGQA